MVGVERYGSFRKNWQMSISDISAGSLNFTAWTQTTSSASPAASSGAPPVSGHHRHHEGGGGPWMQDVQQVLSKMGLSLPQPPSQTQSAAGADADGDSDGSQASGVLSMREDMLRLMHDLFTALKDSQGPAAGGGTTSSDTTATAKVQSYSSNLTSGLQSLLQQYLRFRDRRDFPTAGRFPEACCRPSGPGGIHFDFRCHSRDADAADLPAEPAGQAAESVVGERAGGRRRHPDRCLRLWGRGGRDRLSTCPLRHREVREDHPALRTTGGAAP